MKNKFKLSLLAVSCAALLTACSSSSGGTDNSEQLRKAENTLNKQIADLTQKVKSAQSQAESSQSRYNEAQKRSEASEKEAIKLNEQVANLRKSQAELALAQAEQNKASAQDIEKLKAELEKSDADLTAAKKASEELKAKEAEAEKARQVLEAQKAALANEKDAQVTRVPLSAHAFGGITGEMKDPVSGGLMVINSASGDQLAPTLVEPDEDGINQISVTSSNGKIRSIAIAPPESLSRNKSLKYIRTTGLRYSDLSNTDAFKSTAFGTYNDDDTGQKYLYAHGKPTDLKQMEQLQGQVKYEGSAVYIKNGVNFDKQSGVNATADFANKTINIQIEEAKHWKDDKVEVPAMNFGGKITGNSFAGDVNGIKTQGGFFGENAKELSGIYTNEKDESRGVFGAIKQEAAQ